MSGEFFAVDLDNFYAACGISLNTAIAYLILARGSGGDNATTSWSINAIETRTRISRSRAKNAIDNLLKAGLIEQVKGGKRPQYKIQATKDTTKLDSDAVAWLPNKITESIEGEAPPLERVRQTQDAKILELYIDLYRTQNLLEDGGIPKRVIYKEYDRTLLTECGIYNLWGFSSGKFMNTDPTDELVSAHAEKDSDGRLVFWDRIDRLSTLGLIYWVPMLFESDSPEAEVIHPLGDIDSHDAELTEYARDAALKLLPEEYHHRAENEHDFVVPVLKHLGNVQVTAIMRLRHRPHTKLTAAWWAEAGKRNQEYLEIYHQIISVSGDLQYQGEIKGRSM